MIKIHLVDEHKTCRFRNSAWTICGLRGISWWMVTRDKEGITCKNCLRVVAKREKENG